jgi:phospholipid-binding lipoprotein MlaA
MEESMLKFNNIKSLCVLAVISALLLSSCSETNKVSSADNDKPLAVENQEDFTVDEDFESMEQEFAEDAIVINDPLEDINRFMFGFNDALYFWVVKPTRDGYMAVMPKPARSCIDNVFENLSAPVRFVNCHLQGKPEVADIELKRFLINSTYGLAGIGDAAADQYDIQAPEAEDLGQTLAVHGVGDGFYLVLPLLGPSTLRDAGGKVGDIFLNPQYYLIDHRETSMAVFGGKYLNKSTFYVDEYESLKDDSIDPYIAFRDIYLQYRKDQIEK